MITVKAVRLKAGRVMSEPEALKFCRMLKICPDELVQCLQGGTRR